MFNKILIANRGEIAVRIARACREMGITPVAVYSEVDRAALHVREADEAYLVGPAAATESYLKIENILEAARRAQARAIHPGYGFLSENPRFARACRQAGVKFIGPPPEAMEKLGSKTRARQAVAEAGLPLVPGTRRGLGLEDALKAAEEIGYPVMLKAAAGGGGKGMRAVASAKELPPAFATATSEAERAFGNGEVYLEKLIERPRHIEIQVLADEHGNCVYLGERECSLQRRHQKVVEEAPSAVVDADLRRRMGETATRIAQAAGYTNAGTIEFLVDEERNFYFLEMNTRLQVEHPVTEMVTGLDLAQLQIAIAAGETLPFRQEEISLRGHAIECRVYAEDPENGFLPSPGKITRLITPGGPGIREDSGVYEGWTVPLEYDPMLSKLIAWAPTRAQAIARMQRALGEYFIGGIKSNLSLFRRILGDANFCQAKFDTGYLDRMLAGPGASHNGAPPTPAKEKRDETEMLAAAAAALFSARDANNHRATNPSGAPTSSAWKQAARAEAMSD